MFFQIDSKTFIRTDQIAAVVFGTSYAQVYIAGQPFRVAGHEKIEFLRSLVEPKTSGVSVVDPEIQAQIDTVVEKKRSKK